jgi:hypothetical protein
MKEQLHKLCKQALEQARVNACAKNKTDRPQNNTVWNEFPEVFAELIVKDCVQMFADEGYDESVDMLIEHWDIDPRKLRS